MAAVLAGVNYVAFAWSSDFRERLNVLTKKCLRLQFHGQPCFLVPRNFCQDGDDDDANQEVAWNWSQVQRRFCFDLFCLALGGRVRRVPSYIVMKRNEKSDELLAAVNFRRAALPFRVSKLSR